MAVRLEFVEWVLSYQCLIPNIVFSDESRFEKMPDNTWRRIKRGAWNETCFVKKEKYYPGIMIWAAIGVGYRSGVVKCSKREDSDDYKRIIEESNMIEQCNQLYGAYNWTFMQDGAPCHNSNGTLEWMRPRMMIIPGWPPNSPDLNPIEMVWGILKRKLKKHKWQAEEEVFEVIEGMWRNIDSNVLNSLVKDFVHRCELVVKLGGASCSQYLSSGRKTVKKEDVVDTTNIRRWTDEEDRLLLKLVNGLGHKWAVIGMHIDRSSVEVKNRCRNLIQRQTNDRLRQLLLRPPIPTPMVTERQPLPVPVFSTITSPEG